MRQAVCVLGLFVGLGLIGGCGFTDPLGGTIQNVISQMDQAQAKMNGVSEQLDAVFKVADKEGRQIKKKDLTADPVKTAFKELHDAGTGLVAKKDKAEQMKGKVDAERAEALRKEHGGNIAAKTEDLNKAWNRLKTILQDVRAHADDDAITYLDDEMRTALADFEALTRQK